MTLGAWEAAAELREQGLSWSKVAAELGYDQESMNAQVQAIIEQQLTQAMELGLINQEKFEYKVKYYGDLAGKWIGKIFADAQASDKQALEDYLPSLNSKEDVFKTLGAWEDAEALLDEGLSWSQVATELGFTGDKMHEELCKICEAGLHSAKSKGIISYDQYASKVEYYDELSFKWVEKIFAN